MQCLAIERDLPGDSWQNNSLLDLVRLAVKVFPPSEVNRVGLSKALRAWRYMFTAKRSESGQHLAPREQRQAILLQQNCVVLVVWCVVYKASRIS